MINENAHIDEVVNTVIVQPGLRLEAGVKMYFGETNREEYFIGSVFAILGDHVGQAEVACLVAANGKAPSR